MPVANQNESKSQTSLSITRTFDAPPARVFDAWLDPAQMEKWMGPRDKVARAEILELDARVGGRYRIRMHIKDGPQPIVGGVYREITRPTRLVFTWAWEPEAGYCGDGADQASRPQDDPMLVTVTFRAVGDRTEMTLLHEKLASEEDRAGHEHGWIGSVEQLAAFLRSA
jgi:uncharacterized protein YndB with AHSA1/START domain